MNPLQGMSHLGMQQVVLMQRELRWVAYKHCCLHQGSSAQAFV
jgi:hypothetical protein